MIYLIVLICIVMLTIFDFLRTQEKPKPKDKLIVQPKRIEYNLKLNIKSITTFEKLTHTSFVEFIENKQDDEQLTLALLYSMIVANNNDFKQNFEDTVKYLFTDETIMPIMLTKLQSEVSFSQQFGTCDFLYQTDEITAEEKKDDDKPNYLYILNIVPSLVSDCNLDINYVLYDMPYTDIQNYMHYRDEKHKADLEEKRLFTYTIISPHIDHKKCPYDKFMVFPWISKEKKEKALAEINDVNTINKLHNALANAPKVE